MKLRYIIASFIAAAAVLAGCEKEIPVSVLEGLTVSEDYITLEAEEGSSFTVTVNGVEAWTASVPDDKATWLKLAPDNGAAGKDVKMVLTAEASTSARSTEVHIVMGGKTKMLKVNQKAPVGVEVPLATCKDVIDGPDVTYKVRGMVTKVANTSYGNWYLSDDTGEIYIYGTFNAKGQYPKDAEGGWAAFGIEVGDMVTVEGPKTVYNGVVELVDVSIVKIEKSLIDVEAFDFEILPSIDTTFNMVIKAKESPLLVQSDSDWLQVQAVNADGSYKLHADENIYSAKRTANVSIKGPTAIKSVAIQQAGAPATGASISEIIAMADGSEVETLPSSVVVALTSKGAVLSDGAKVIYVYDAKAAELNIGDGVRLNATKTTYNGVPELKDVTDLFVDSQGNSFTNPAAKDITPDAATYTASEAEYVKMSGTLTINHDKGYYNLVLDEFPEGEHQGSISSPAASLKADSFENKKITVTGWFNGISGGKFINIIATKIEEFVDNPKGTLANPYSCTEIAALITGGNIPDEDVYIKGIVSDILFTFSTYNGTGTFWMSDDGKAYGLTEDKKSSTDPANDFECYSVNWFDGKAWVEGNAQVEIGDEVIVYGKTTIYNGVAETSKQAAHIYSINGALFEEDGLGSTAYPFNISGAVAFIDRMVEAKAAAKATDQPEPKFPDVCVKGKISSVVYYFSDDYNTATFWMSDDGTAYGVTDDKKSTNEPKKDFECYSIYNRSIENDWVEGDTQIEVGDEVVVKGQLTYYASKGIYETNNKQAWLYSLNGEVE